MYHDYFLTPIGTIKIVATTKALTEVRFVEHAANKRCANEITSACREQLGEYFDKKRRYFDLPLDPGGTLFQKQVWHSLMHIPFGHTASYSDIANSVNNPKAVRAVGLANGKNPIGIIVPCHRIIGKNGQLTGYAGGLARKAWLLAHENLEK